MCNSLCTKLEMISNMFVLGIGGTSHISGFTYSSNATNFQPHVKYLPRLFCSYKSDMKICHHASMRVFLRNLIVTSALLRVTPCLLMVDRTITNCRLTTITQSNNTAYASRWDRLPCHWHLYKADLHGIASSAEERARMSSRRLLQ
jgi:hypothetical protein